MLLALIKNLLERIQGLSRRAYRFNDPQDRGLVVSDAEAEHQAYQEEKREHAGG